MNRYNRIINDTATTLSEQMWICATLWRSVRLRQHNQQYQGNFESNTHTCRRMRIMKKKNNWRQLDHQRTLDFYVFHLPSIYDNTDSISILFIPNTHKSRCGFQTTIMPNLLLSSVFCCLVDTQNGMRVCIHKRMFVCVCDLCPRISVDWCDAASEKSCCCLGWCAATWSYARLRYFFSSLCFFFGCVLSRWFNLEFNNYRDEMTSVSLESHIYTYICLYVRITFFFCSYYWNTIWICVKSFRKKVISQLYCSICSNKSNGLWPIRQTNWCMSVIRQRAWTEMHI